MQYNVFQAETHCILSQATVLPGATSYYLRWNGGKHRSRRFTQNRQGDRQGNRLPEVQC